MQSLCIGLFGHLCFVYVESSLQCVLSSGSCCSFSLLQQLLGERRKGEKLNQDRVLFLYWSCCMIHLLLARFVLTDLLFVFLLSSVFCSLVSVCLCLDWVYSLKFFGSFWSIISTALHLILISRTFRQVICIDYGAVVSFALHFGDNLPACLQKCVPKFVLVQWSHCRHEFLELLIIAELRFRIQQLRFYKLNLCVNFRLCRRRNLDWFQNSSVSGDSLVQIWRFRWIEWGFQWVGCRVIKIPQCNIARLAAYLHRNWSNNS